MSSDKSALQLEAEKYARMRDLLVDEWHKAETSPDPSGELVRARLINQLDTINAKLIELEQQGILPNPPGAKQ